jgi:hypothetical protein
MLPSAVVEQNVKNISMDALRDCPPELVQIV